MSILEDKHFCPVFLSKYFHLELWSAYYVFYLHYITGFCILEDCCHGDVWNVWKIATMKSFFSYFSSFSRSMRENPFNCFLSLCSFFKACDRFMPLLVLGVCKLLLRCPLWRSTLGVKCRGIETTV